MSEPTIIESIPDIVPESIDRYVIPNMVPNPTVLSNTQKNWTIIHFTQSQ